MWMCAPAHNPASTQLEALVASLADMHTKSRVAMPALPHEDTPTALHAVMFTNPVDAMHAEQHADKYALRHFANAHMPAHQQVHLRTCPHSQLSYNSTPQQEGMRT